MAALGPACNRIRKSVAKHGKHQKEEAPAVIPPAPVEKRDYVTDENDIKSILQSWMGGRPSSENQKVIRFSEVDLKLDLKPGSTEKYIEEIATNWSYLVERKGTETILFRKRPPQLVRTYRSDF